MTENLVIFERERAAFEQLKPELLKQYPNKYVAIVDGRVVEVGEDKLQVREYASVLGAFQSMCSWFQLNSASIIFLIAG